MSWLLIAIIAYFILALVNLADKFVLEKVIPGPKTYTFLVGATGAVVIVAAPWFLNWPGWALLFFNFLVGSFFAGGLFFLYRGLKGAEATRIFTLVGGLVPVFTVLFSVAIFKEVFSTNQWLALFFLILGTIIISNISEHHNIWFNIRKFLHIFDEHKFPAIVSSLISALFFALFWVGTKEVYNTQEFISGFIWVRLGTFITVLFLLILPSSRQEIFSEIRNSNENKNNKFVYFGVQGAGALGSILQNYAVSLGSVALVTSLQGMQYALLLILGTLFSLFLPKIFKEDYDFSRLWKKILAVLFIALGLFFMAF